MNKLSDVVNEGIAPLTTCYENTFSYYANTLLVTISQLSELSESILEYGFTSLYSTNT